MKPVLIAISVVLITLVIAPSLAKDTADARAIRGWTVAAGSWTITKKTLTGQGVSAEIVSTNSFPSDRTVTITMQTISTVGSNTTCCAYYVARANGKYVDFYDKVFMDIWTTGITNLVISTSTTYSEHPLQTTISPFNPHTVKMVFLGNDLTVYIDGVQYYKITDTRIGALGNAAVALSSWGPSESTFLTPRIG